MKVMARRFRSPFPPASLPHPKGSIEGVQEVLFAEWFEETLDRSRRQQLGSHGVVAARGDEDDRDVLATCPQCPLKVWARHSWHRDVEDETTRLTHDIRGEKRFG